jgi:hypothetical protein
VVLLAGSIRHAGRPKGQAAGHLVLRNVVLAFTIERQQLPWNLQDSQGFDVKWRDRVSEYEASVATQLCNLKQQHEAQTTDLLIRCEQGRPSRPQHSADILNGRKIEEVLVKQVGLGLHIAQQ